MERVYEATSRQRGRAAKLHALVKESARLQEADTDRLRTQLARKAKTLDILRKKIALEKELEARRCKACDLMKAQAWGLGHQDWFHRRCAQCWAERAAVQAGQRHLAAQPAGQQRAGNDAAAAEERLFVRLATSRPPQRSDGGGVGDGGGDGGEADAIGLSVRGGNVEAVVDALRRRDAVTLVALMDASALERHFGVVVPVVRDDDDQGAVHDDSASSQHDGSDLSDDGSSLIGSLRHGVGAANIGPVRILADARRHAGGSRDGPPMAGKHSSTVVRSSVSRTQTPDDGPSASSVRPRRHSTRSSLAPSDFSVSSLSLALHSPSRDGGQPAVRHSVSSLSLSASELAAEADATCGTPRRNAAHRRTSMASLSSDADASLSFDVLQSPPAEGPSHSLGKQPSFTATAATGQLRFGPPLNVKGAAPARHRKSREPAEGDDSGGGSSTDDVASLRPAHASSPTGDASIASSSAKGSRGVSQERPPAASAAPSTSHHGQLPARPGAHVATADAAAARHGPVIQARKHHAGGPGGPSHITGADARGAAPVTIAGARGSRGGGGGGSAPAARAVFRPTEEEGLLEALRQAEHSLVFGATQKERSAALLDASHLREAIADLRQAQAHEERVQAVRRREQKRTASAAVAAAAARGGRGVTAAGRDGSASHLAFKHGSAQEHGSAGSAVIDEDMRYWDRLGRPVSATQYARPSRQPASAVQTVRRDKPSSAHVPSTEVPLAGRKFWDHLGLPAFVADDAPQQGRRGAASAHVGAGDDDDEEDEAVWDRLHRRTDAADHARWIARRKKSSAVAQRDLMPSGAVRDAGAVLPTSSTAAVSESRRDDGRRRQGNVKQSKLPQSRVAVTHGAWVDERLMMDGDGWRPVPSAVALEHPPGWRTAGDYSPDYIYHRELAKLRSITIDQYRFRTANDREYQLALLEAEMDALAKERASSVASAKESRQAAAVASACTG